MNSVEVVKILKLKQQKKKQIFNHKKTKKKILIEDKKDLQINKKRCKKGSPTSHEQRLLDFQKQNFISLP